MAQLEALGAGAGAGGEAGRAARAAPQLQRREIRPYLLLAVKELSGNPDSRTSSVASTERYACVRAVVRHFARMRSAVTGGWSGEDVKVFLEGLRFTPECVAELTPLLCSEEVYANLPTHRYAQPQLVSMQWKIDISLCQVNLSTDERRGDETSTKQLLHRDTFVILIFTLADGTTRAYRMGIRKFHEIRFALATALKNMLVLERRKCMRSDGHS